MSYDEKLADRIRAIFNERHGFSEKKMFGGLTFMFRGNMCCGVVERELMIRVGAKAYEEALARPYAREMDFTRRPLKGMVYVSSTGIRTDKQLRAWLERGVSFARSLPAK